MKQVIMDMGITETGFCCACDLLEGWIVTGPHDFEEFKQYVQESIDFYIECAKEDGYPYPSVFDGEYQIVYKLIGVSIE